MKVLILSLLFICFGCVSSADLAFDLANQCRIEKGAGNCDPEWAAYNEADDKREASRLRKLEKKNKYPCPKGLIAIVDGRWGTHYCVGKVIIRSY